MVAVKIFLQKLYFSKKRRDAQDFLLKLPVKARLKALELKAADNQVLSPTPSYSTIIYR